MVGGSRAGAKSGLMKVWSPEGGHTALAVAPSHPDPLCEKGTDPEVLAFCVLRRAQLMT